MNIKSYLTDKLQQTFAKLGYDTDFAKVTFSDRQDIAHLQCNGAFGLAKKLGQNPMVIAQNIVDAFVGICSEFNVTVAKPAFINFIINDDTLSKIANDTLNDKLVGVTPLAKPLTVVMDYAGPNVAKPLHVGHLRSGVIGEAIKRLNRLLGNKVIGDIHLGDWGLQMGLTIAQLMDDYDMSGYFDSTKPKQEITLEMLDVAYPKASTRKKVDEEFADRASTITLKLQHKEPGYYDIWQVMRKVSIDDIKKTYDKLNVSFDLWKGESSTNDIVPSVVKQLKDSGLAYVSQGALVVDVDDFSGQPMPPAIILKSNGAQMYIITDIATIVDRMQYKPDVIKYFTDNRQVLHFKQVFGVTHKAGLIPDNVELQHYSFGTVNGKDGKPFKTRDGGTMRLNDLIAMATQKAKERLLENKQGICTDELATKIAVSAIKYGDLSNIVSKDYIFDVDKFTTFEGKTGPYLQYTAVRINSLLGKANYKGGAQINIHNDESRKIVFAVLKLIDSYYTCYTENSLNTLCAELYNLASAYSNFYNNVKILTEPDQDKRNSYLAVSELVYKSLSQGLSVLGIDVPDVM